jgi:hypothetical protein
MLFVSAPSQALHFPPVVACYAGFSFSMTGVGAGTVGSLAAGVADGEISAGDLRAAGMCFGFSPRTPITAGAGSWYPNLVRMLGS